MTSCARVEFAISVRQLVLYVNGQMRLHCEIRWPSVSQATVSLSALVRAAEAKWRDMPPHKELIEEDEPDWVLFRWHAHVHRSVL